VKSGFPAFACVGRPEADVGAAGPPSWLGGDQARGGPGCGGWSRWRAPVGLVGPGAIAGSAGQRQSVGGQPLNNVAHRSSASSFHCCRDWLGQLLRSPKLQRQSGRLALRSSRPRLRTPERPGHPLAILNRTRQLVGVVVCMAVVVAEEGWRRWRGTRGEVGCDGGRVVMPGRRVRPWSISNRRTKLASCCGSRRLGRTRNGPSAERDNVEDLGRR
jgi:hypothetical protein